MRMEAAGTLWVVLAVILVPAWSFGSTVTTGKAGGNDWHKEFLQSINKTIMRIKQAIYPTKDENSKYSTVSCDFSTSMCGWENVGGENYTLHWTMGWNSYVRLYMKSNLKGRLASPWLHPVEKYRCQLIFRYYIRKNAKNCQLSLIMKTFTGAEQTVWFTQNSTGYFYFSSPVKTEINCSIERYRLIFEAWKSCDVNIYNEIDIKAIKFLVFPENEIPVTEASAAVENFTIKRLATLESTTPESISSNPDPGVKDSDDTKSNNTSLAVDVLAAIIVSGVVVVIAVVVIIIVIVKYCRRMGKRERKPSRWDGSGNVNSAHILEVEDDTYNHTSTSAPRQANEDDTYDHTSTSAPRQANEDDTYDHTSTSAPRQANEDDTYDHTSTSAPRQANEDDTYDHAGGTPLPALSADRGEDNNYHHIHLNQAPQPVSGHDTYDHTNSGSADYQNTSQHLGSPALSLPATSSQGAAAIFAQAETTDYECVDGEDFELGLPVGDDDDMYNRLDLSGARKQEERRPGERMVEENKPANANDYDHVQEGGGGRQVDDSRV